LDALKTRSVNIGGAYRELWGEDYRLTVETFGTREVSAVFDGKWSFPAAKTEYEALYVSSAAAIADAAAENDIPEALIRQKNAAGLLPEELLRFLLDELGYSMESAVNMLIRVFGRELRGICEKPWLAELCPRANALCAVLKNELQRGYAVFDCYDEAYHSPPHAAKTDREVCFRIFPLSELSSAELVISGGGTQLRFQMERNGEYYSAAHSFTEPEALRFVFILNGSRYLCADDGGHCGVMSTSLGEGFRQTVYASDFETPEWFKGGIMYQIFPDRFGFDGDSFESGIAYHKALGQTPEKHENISEAVKFRAREGEKDYAPDDFYGGSLKGIEAKLPYLRSLGVSAVYLNPIVEARSNHRYDTSDYMKVDPILGSVEDYVNLCAAAEKHGIRIINDGVFSHTGADSRYFNRFGSYGEGGAYNSTESPYYPWYDFKSFPDDYRCWWGFRDLPEVNELDHDWQREIVSGEDSVLKAWLIRGASGWRLDVADELPDSVLALIRRSAKSVKPDALIIGEVWEDAVEKISYGLQRSYALGSALDSVMNYPLRKAILDFCDGKSSAYQLRDFLLAQQHNYPRPMYECLMNLLGSHDVERLHTHLALGSDLRALSREEQAELRLTEDEAARGTRLQKLAAAIQYSLPGVPCLYYGDEECLDGASDPFNRAPFKPNKLGLYDYYCRLGELRSGSRALSFGELELYTPNRSLIVIKRVYDAEAAYCIANMSESPFDASEFCAGTVIEPYWAEIIT